MWYVYQVSIDVLLFYNIIMYASSYLTHCNQDGVKLFE